MSNKIFRNQIWLVFFFQFGLLLSAYGDYKPLTEDDPVVFAILWGQTQARVLIYYKGFKYHLGQGMRLDKEWTVEEIRRETVLFRKKSTHAFIEIPVLTRQRAKRHMDWSFWGEPISLWEALECVARAFNKSLVMHFASAGTVIPRFHADTLERMLIKIIPSRHRFAQTEAITFVLPVEPFNEAWGKVLERMRLFRSDFLTQRFPGMEQAGNLLCRGEDIQVILRRIALGAQVPIKFPPELHFPVYAVFTQRPYHQILAKIVYLNQCIIIERISHLEVYPFFQSPELIVSPNLTVGPMDFPDGVDDNPPPVEPPQVPAKSMSEFRKIPILENQPDEAGNLPEEEGLSESKRSERN